MKTQQYGFIYFCGRKLSVRNIFDHINYLIIRLKLYYYNKAYKISDGISPWKIVRKLSDDELNKYLKYRSRYRYLQNVQCWWDKKYWYKPWSPKWLCHPKNRNKLNVVKW